MSRHGLINCIWLYGWWVPHARHQPANIAVTRLRSRGRSHDVIDPPAPDCGVANPHVPSMKIDRAHLDALGEF